MKNEESVSINIQDLSNNRLKKRYVRDSSNNQLYTIPKVKQQMATKRYSMKQKKHPRMFPPRIDIETSPFIFKKKSGDFVNDKESICSHICKALPLVCKNFSFYYFILNLSKQYMII